MHTPSRVFLFWFRSQSFPGDDEIADVAEQPPDDGQVLQEKTQSKIQQTSVGG